MIRFILVAALVGGLLQHVFGDVPAQRKGNAPRARPKGFRTRRPRRVRAAAVSR
jgi:hypothetical protein